MDTRIASSTAIATSGTAVPKSQTAVASSTAVAAGTAVASGDNNKRPARVTDVPEYEEYVIEGIIYKHEAVISNSSGEAKVVKVSANGKEFALKIYKPGHKPDHAVLQTLSQLKGNGFVIDIYAHGVWTDGKSGQEFDYELMQYCKGRSLAALKLNGDEERLKGMAMRMTAAIDFCHRNNILHRDIKPANFMFTGTDEKEFVLSDFGIARHLDNDGKVVVDYCRTPIYAAPEMYDYNFGEQNYVTKKSDWYAMGMTLLALWTGEGVLTADERKLIQDKREGTIPYPTLNEMSEHTLSLLKALTRMNPAKRATYDDIVRWAKGEIIYRDPHAINDSLKNFRVVFSAKDNLIAHSPKELGEIMWGSKTLAKKYLYSEQVAKWLRDAERPEDAMEMDVITEKLYPGDQDAGLYAACLVLNPELKYTGKKGNKISTKEELSEELFDNMKIYCDELTNATHPFWVYCNSLGLQQRVKTTQSIMKKNKISALLCLVYDLDVKRPFLTKIDDKIYTIPDLPTLFKLVETKTLNDSNISKLYSHEFIVWAKNQNLAATRNGVNVNDFGWSNSTRMWRLLYTLAPGYGYDFKAKDDSDMFTSDGVMHELTREIMGQPNRQFNLSSQISSKNFDDTRLSAYLESKIKYKEQIRYIKDCMDFDSDVNKVKYGPYNRRIALMKVATGIIGEIIPLTINNVTVHNIKELEQEKRLNSSQLNEMQADLMQDWLALQFQENPYADYDKRSYLDLTRDYCDYLNRNVPNSSCAQKSNAIVDAINAAKRKFNNAWTKTNAVRWGVIWLCLVPLILACCASVYVLATNDADVFSEIMRGVGNAVGGIVGIVAGLYLLFTVHWIAGVIGFFIIYQVIVWLCSAISVAIPWILIGIIIIIAAYYAIKFFKCDKKKLEDKWSDMDMDEAQSFATIGAAFNSTDKLLPSLPTDYPACVYTSGADKAKRVMKDLRLNAVIVVVLTVLSLLFIGWLTNKATELEHKATTIVEDTKSGDGITSLEGTFYGKLDGKNASLTLVEKEVGRKDVTMEGEVRVMYDTPMVHKVRGKVAINSDKKDFTLYKVKDNGKTDTRVSYRMLQIPGTNGKPELTGLYVNKINGTKKEFSFEKD